MGRKSNETSRIFCGHFNFPELNRGVSVIESKIKISNNVVILKKTCQEKVLKYLEVMISKFSGHLILIFIRRILAPPRTIWACQGVSHFSNKCSSTVYTNFVLDWWDSFFLKCCWGICLNGGTKKISGGNLPWMMPWIWAKRGKKDLHIALWQEL